MNRYSLLIAVGVSMLLLVTLGLQFAWLRNSYSLELRQINSLVRIAVSSPHTHQKIIDQVEGQRERKQEITPLELDQQEIEWRAILDSVLHYQDIYELDYEFELLRRGALESTPKQSIFKSLYYEKTTKQKTYQTYQKTIYPNYKRNPFAYGYQDQSYLLLFSYSTNRINIWKRLKSVLFINTMIFLLWGVAIWAIWIALKKQKKAEQVRIDFLNGMTHELNTPITVIQLAAQFTRKKFDEKNAFITDTMKTIQYEAHKMKNLVASILTTARLHKDKFNMNKSSHHVHEQIKSVMTTYKWYLAGINSKLKVNLNAHNDKIIGDKFHLYHALSNLVDNAIKYRDSQNKFELNISTKNETLETICITIEDNGIGIAKKDLASLFERNVRTDQVSNNIKGFGFGMAYVKDVIDLHEGASIKIESTLSKGTTFFVRFSTTTKEE